MTCINCQYEFCWICLKKFTEDHYAIYNLLGCPGMEFGKFLYFLISILKLENSTGNFVR